MKVEITEKGVYDAKGSPIRVGAELTIKGGEVPAWLVSKCRVIADTTGKTAVTNSDDKAADTTGKTA